MVSISHIKCYCWWIPRLYWFCLSRTGDVYNLGQICWDFEAKIWKPAYYVINPFPNLWKSMLFQQSEYALYGNFITKNNVSGCAHLHTYKYICSVVAANSKALLLWLLHTFCFVMFSSMYSQLCLLLLFYSLLLLYCNWISVNTWTWTWTILNYTSETYLKNIHTLWDNWMFKSHWLDDSLTQRWTHWLHDRIKYHNKKIQLTAFTFMRNVQTKMTFLNYLYSLVECDFFKHWI